MMRPAIQTHIERGNPPEYQWFASYGEWDSGDPCGIGATEAEAIADLLQWSPIDGPDDEMSSPSVSASKKYQGEWI